VALPTSLRLRLLIAACLAILLALAASGILLARLFIEHVEHRAASELETHLNQIVASLELDPNGALTITANLADPRFKRPYSGLYWQLDIKDGPRQRSRSLWDFELVLPLDDLADGSVHRHRIAGPNKAKLLAVERALSVGTGEKPRPVRLTLAVDRAEIEDAMSEFRPVLAKSLAVIGTALLLAFGGMLHVGLAPLKRLGAVLQDVHAGARPKVDGEYPSEVQSLVVDVNRLLDKERHSIERASERAADLAHGFKTPLAVLGAVARELKRDGRENSAAEIDLQVDLMGRHVRRELARVRAVGAAAIGQSGVDVMRTVDRVVTTLRRLAEDRNLDWIVEGDPTIRFAGDETDLLEIIGNLGENASKWARSSVRVSARSESGDVILLVDDDGPGIAAGTETSALVRGQRLDEAAGGTGLGLQIVAKVVDSYGGSLALSASPEGGLRAMVRLPAIVNGTSPPTRED
jgi:signal transduction histidine kinase